MEIPRGCTITRVRVQRKMAVAAAVRGTPLSKPVNTVAAWGRHLALSLTAATPAPFVSQDQSRHLGRLRPPGMVGLA